MDSNRFSSFEQLAEHAGVMGVSLSSGDVSVLSRPLEVGGKVIPNRLLIQPVECGDALPDGAPGELTRRRYLRFAAGGAGLVWMEATAILPELKSHPSQLVLTSQTLGSFQRLLADMREAALARNETEPLIVVQLSHPGRSCLKAPKPASDREVWDKIRSAQGESAVSDDEIERLSAIYGDAAKLAKQAGFDGIEIKACHSFFVSELLSARGRPGRYGGSFGNRARHLKESLAAARAEAGDMFLAVRLNIYDGIPYPDGFGMKEGGGFSFDAAEPVRLLEEIKDEFAVELVNCTSNSPNWKLFPNAYIPQEQIFSSPDDPLKNGARMHRFASVIKAAVPAMKVVATAFSHLKQYAPTVGAGMIERGEADLIGFGRQALAYPDFARDILLLRGMDREKVCLCCGGCGKLFGSGTGGGCVLRDERYKNSLKKV